MSDLATLAALGATPIAGASPAGASARYEPEFEKIFGEIAKLESVDGRGLIRWGEVVDGAVKILGSKSKDLLAASYLTLGLLHKNGYAGLAVGLAVVRNLLTHYWDGLFPEKNRMRARAQALQWMTERVAPELAARSGASKSDQETLASCVEAANAIAGIAREKFENEGPDLGKLMRAVEDKLASVPADEPPPAASEPEPASPPPAAPHEIDSADSAREALAGMRDRRIKAAAALREANPADPLPYRLLRAAVWEDVLEALPSKDGVCEPAGGDASFAREAEEKLERGEYAAVLAECEGRLPNDRLWLDLNFLSCRALEGLGRPYAAARRALGDEVARLVRGVPALLDLKFADGTPMASEPTRLWILHELGALPSQGGASGSLDATMAEARKLVARKKFPEAAALLQKELKSAPHRRDRFLVRLYLAKLCGEAGRPELAIPQLEGLDEEARKLALEEWEPALCADLARELWKCYRASPMPEKANEHYARLCRLDLGAVLAADGRK